MLKLRHLVSIKGDKCSDLKVSRRLGACRASVAVLSTGMLSMFIIKLSVIHGGIDVNKKAQLSCR